MAGSEQARTGVVSSLNKAPVIGLVGATGLVGGELLTTLAASSLPVGELRIYASTDSVGEMYRFRSEELEVREFDFNEIPDLDVIIWASSLAVPLELQVRVKECGRILIDLGRTSIGSIFFPHGHSSIDTSVSADSSVGGVYLVPSTTSLLLRPLIMAHQAVTTIERVVVTTFEGVAGAGKDGLDELWGQGLAIYNQKPVEVQQFAAQIAFNCIPQIHLLGEDGVTLEEQRVQLEVLSEPPLPISVTAVRVPVFHGHGLSVSIISHENSEIGDTELQARFVLELKKCPNVVVYELGDLPTHLSVIGTHDIHVARVRYNRGILSAWVVADGLYVGAIDPVMEILQRSFPS